MSATYFFVLGVGSGPGMFRNALPEWFDGLLVGMGITAGALYVLSLIVAFVLFWSCVGLIVGLLHGWIPAMLLRKRRQVLSVIAVTTSLFVCLLWSMTSTGLLGDSFGVFLVVSSVLLSGVGGLAAGLLIIGLQSIVRRLRQLPAP